MGVSTQCYRFVTFSVAYHRMSRRGAKVRRLFAGQNPLHTSHLKGRRRLLFADPHQQALLFAYGKHPVKPQDQGREVKGVQS